MIVDWFEKERGINDTTLSRWKVDALDTQRPSVAFKHGKIKYLDGKEPRFKYVSGKKAVLFFGPSRPGDTLFLVEGETDAMRLDQELEEKGVAARVAGLPGIMSWQDGWVSDFADFTRVMVVLDNDSDYKVASSTDKQWLKIKKALGSKAIRITLPEDTEDLCDFFSKYKWDLFEQITDQSLATSMYTPLNLQDPSPEPTEWLLQGRIAKGDLHLLMGDPGVGKSWILMSIAVAAAKGEDWAGFKMTRPMRVLYVDEENPQSVIYERLVSLGLGPDDPAAHNIRYLSRQGVRLDVEPDKLTEDAQIFGPDIIVLDSLNRIHTLEENSAGDMGRLFNDGIRPLITATGAAVLLIHHPHKGQGSGYQRTRGSGDITAAVDTAFDMRRIESPTGHENVSIRPFKARRGETEKSLVRWMTEDGVTKFENVIKPTAKVSDII